MEPGAALRLPRPWRGLLILPLFLATALSCGPTDDRAKARALFDDAIRMAERQPEPLRSFYLSRIASQLAPIDPDRALAVTEQVKDYRFKALAYKAVSYQLAKIDVRRALSIADRIVVSRLEHSAKYAAVDAVAEQDPVKALELANQMAGLMTLEGNGNWDWKRTSLRSRAVATIAKYDLGAAEAMARAVTDENERAGLLLTVASAFVREDPERALAMVHNLRFRGSSDPCGVWMAALTAFGEKRPATAIDLLPMMPKDCYFYSDREFMKLLESLSKANSDQVLAALESNFDRLSANWGYHSTINAIFRLSHDEGVRFLEKKLEDCRMMDELKLRYACARQSLDSLENHEPARAIRWLDDLTPAQERRWHLSQIARNSAHKEPERTLSLASQINDEWIREQTIREALITLARTDPERALALVNNLKHGDVNDYILSAAIDSFTKSDPEKAIALSGGVQSPIARVITLLKISTTLGDTHRELAIRVLQDALKTVQLMPAGKDDKWTYIRMQGNYDLIAQIIYRVFSLDSVRGQEMIEGIKDPKWRDRVLESVVGMQLNQNDPRAQSLLRQIQSSETKDSMTKKLATTVTEKDEAQALQLLDQIKSPMVKGMGLEKVARVVFQTDPERGWKMFRDAIRLQRTERTARGLRWALEDFQKATKGPVPHSAFQYYYEAAAMARHERHPEELARIAADLWRLSATDKPDRTG